MVKAKVRCTSIKHTENFSTVELVPVYGSGEENKTWSKYTPSGKIELCITNPDAVAYLELGSEFYLTFEKAAKPVEVAA